MGARRIRREQRQYDQKKSRRENGVEKVNERARRDRRMVELVKKYELPYTPSIMSWISVKANKPSTRITKEDVDKVVAECSG